MFAIYGKPQEIKIARIKAGLFQAEVAQNVGITPNAYAQIENGRRSTTGKTARRISECLNTDLERIFTIPGGGLTHGNDADR